MKFESKHLISHNATVRDALKALDLLASDAILIVVDENNRLVGSLTDGDLRRGFIKGSGFEDSLNLFIQANPKYFFEDEFNQDLIEEYRVNNYKIIPIVDREMTVIDILNFRKRSTLLPLEAVMMAGGEGKRLRPLTESIPKPLLKVGEKPIIEYNIDRLCNVGIKNIHISINYLGEQIIEQFGNGDTKNISINYIKESKPLGTIASVLLVEKFSYDDILVMNSDLLTNIDFADFYKTYKSSGADMIVAATTFSVDIPYAVLETDQAQRVKSLKEKPKYSYFSNAGIYIISKKLFAMIPKDTFFDVTDLMEKVLEMNLNLTTYPINGYWLDIGRHEDYIKAQEDIKHLRL